MNGNDWVTIDEHTNEPLIDSSKQMIIFDVKRVRKCSTFRFFFPGVDSLGRYFNYLGPVEFYGKVYPLTYCFDITQHRFCKPSNKVFCKIKQIL